MDYEFEPPFGQRTLETPMSERALGFLLIGNPIAISELAIMGEPIWTALRKPSMSGWPPGYPTEVKTVPMKLDQVESKVWYQLKMPANFQIAGFWFSSLANFQELVVRYWPKADTIKSDKIYAQHEHFRVPSCPTPCQILLAEPVDMERCHLLFLGATEEFREPAVKGVAATNRAEGKTAMKRSRSFTPNLL
jgi:hypothetical protein